MNSVLILLGLVAGYIHFSKPDAIPEGEPSLTLYYSVRCSHCLHMLPEWNRLPRYYRGILIRTVESRMIGDEYPIQGFPTIIFRDGNGVSEKYGGARTALEITGWLDGV